MRRSLRNVEKKIYVSDKKVIHSLHVVDWHLACMLNIISRIEAHGNGIKRAHTGKRYLIVFLVSVYSEVVAMMRLELYQEAVRMELAF